MSSLLLQPGVDISRLNREMRRALDKLSAIYNGLIVTSTYEGDHSAGSLHYANDAADFRKLSAWSGTLDAERMRRVLGPGYNVVAEVLHVHVEWNPKCAAALRRVPIP